MSKFKSVNKYLESEIIQMDNKAKYYCLMLCQTGVLSFGTPCRLKKLENFLLW